MIKCRIVNVAILTPIDTASDTVSEIHGEASKRNPQAINPKELPKKIGIE